MRKIKVTVSTGYSGCGRDCEFAVEDDVTDEEVDEIALERLFEMIEWSWYESNE